MVSVISSSTFPLLSQIIQHSTHTSAYPPAPVCTSASLRHRICAYQCCFPACSPARLHGCTPIRLNQQSLPLTSLSPPRHRRGPLSLHRHLSFYPSFDISAPSVISEVPLSAEVPLWHKWGVSPKIPTGLHVFHHKGALYFLIVLRHDRNSHPSRQGSD